MISYKNGNTVVNIYPDGTKERIFDGIPISEFPESIDVKITNYCDAGCSYCHEMSTTSGQHGDLDRLISVLSSLPSGIELAIGGGSAQSHPDFNSFILNLTDRGFIPNLTINQKHLEKDFDKIKSLINNIYGIGISYSSNYYISQIKKYLEISDNIVFHFILGINKLQDIDELNEVCKSMNKKCKILLLGYKHFGFGINYYVKNSNIEKNKYSWYTQLPRFFNNDNIVLSFDNLAINQLKLKRFFTEEGWNKFYMGDDYTHTMYIDAVKQQYAPTSTSNVRVSFDECSLIEFFERRLK